MRAGSVSKLTFSVFRPGSGGVTSSWPSAPAISVMWWTLGAPCWAVPRVQARQPASAMPGSQGQPKYSGPCRLRGPAILSVRAFALGALRQPASAPVAWPGMLPAGHCSAAGAMRQLAGSCTWPSARPSAASQRCSTSRATRCSWASRAASVHDGPRRVGVGRPCPCHPRGRQRSGSAAGATAAGPAAMAAGVSGGLSSRASGMR